MTLNIRCLVIEKKDEVDNFLQFAKMAQDAQNQKLSSRILASLKQDLQKSQEMLLKEEKK
jgi:hypothetical protein